MSIMNHDTNASDFLNSSLRSVRDRRLKTPVVEEGDHSDTFPSDLDHVEHTFDPIPVCKAKTSAGGQGESPKPSTSYDPLAGYMPDPRTLSKPRQLQPLSSSDTDFSVNERPSRSRTRRKKASKVRGKKSVRPNSDMGGDNQPSISRYDHNRFRSTTQRLDATNGNPMSSSQPISSSFVVVGGTPYPPYVPNSDSDPTRSHTATHLPKNNSKPTRSHTRANLPNGDISTARSQSPTHYCQECNYRDITCSHSVLGRSDMEQSLSRKKQKVEEKQEQFGIKVSNIGSNNTINININTPTFPRQSYSDSSEHTELTARQPEQSTYDHVYQSQGTSTRHDLASTQTPRQPRLETITELPSTSRGTRAIKQTYRVNIKMQSDNETSDVTDICQLPDGTFAITDTRNKKVKFLNKDYKPVACWRMTDFPQYICHVKGPELAVTLIDWSIRFVKNVKSDKCRGPIILGYACKGISHYDGKLYVTDWGRHVYVYYLNGAPMYKLSETFINNQLFSRTRQISVNRVDGTLYVTDYDNGLISVPRKRRTSPLTLSLKDAIGLCLDESNRTIYVSSQDSQSVTAIGMNSNSVLYDIDLYQYDTDDPKAIGFDITKRRLLISTPKCDNLTVFDLY